MLGVRCEKVSKKYKNHWLFRELSCEITPGSTLAILGPNGTGKSTLLKMIAGHTHTTEGTIQYITSLPKPLAIERANVYQQISWTGPALDLYPAFTVVEALTFHFQLKECLLPTIEECLVQLDLFSHRNKTLRELSSGMLQKFRFGLALFSQSKILLLDEPTTFMDTQNADNALMLLLAYRKNRTLILASNALREYDAFPNRLYLNEYQ